MRPPGLAFGTLALALSFLCFLASSASAAGHKGEKKNQDPRACQTSADCIVFCPVVAGCCTSPCGCREAVNQKYTGLAKRLFKKECVRVPHCPAYDCAYEPAVSAECRNGRCVALSGRDALLPRK